MKILFVLPRTPWPPYAGQARLAFFRAKELRKLGYDVSLYAYGISLPLNYTYAKLDSANAYDRVNLYSSCAMEHFITILRSLYSWIFCNIPLVSLVYTPAAAIVRFKHLIAFDKFDVVHFYSINSYPLWSQTSAPCVIDLVDSMTLNLKKRAPSVPYVVRFLFRKEFKCISKFETALPVGSNCSAVLSVSDTDLGFFSLANAKSIIAKPIFRTHNIGVEVHDYVTPEIDASKPLKILFFGSLYYHPNVEAALWFVENVCPLLLEELDFSFLIAGSSPDTALVKLSRNYDFVQLVVNPLNMNALISLSDISVAPIQSGSGQQFKVLESLASSTPVVATTLASRPLGLVNRKHLLVSDTPHSFAESILSLVSDKFLCKQLTRCGWEYVSQMFSWRVKAVSLDSLYSTILSCK